MIDSGLTELLAAAGATATGMAGIGATFYRFYTGEWPTPRNGRAVHRRMVRIEEAAKEAAKEATQTKIETMTAIDRLESHIAFIRGWLEGRIGRGPSENP